MKSSELFAKAFLEKNGIQRFIARKLLFSPLESMGFHILGDHFYEPIPNLGLVRKTYHDETLQLPFGHSPDIGAIEEQFTATLEQFRGEMQRELSRVGYWRNPYFRAQDAVSLFSFVRKHSIQTIVEIGQGYSTLVALAALDINTENNPVTFVSIDPHDRLGCQGNSRFKSRVTLIQRPVQSISPGDIIKHLGPNSLLFVDSSHVFKFGSDVEYLMRQIYPRLPEGTFLHVHDIYTPYPVPRERMLKDKLFFNEQEHLESFLALNASFEIILPVHWLNRVSRKFQNFVEAIFKFQDLPGNSMYLRRITGS